MERLVQRIKIAIAKTLSRIYYWIYDPQVESQIGDVRDYEFYQSERRRKMELYLAKYLGPKL